MSESSASKKPQGNQLDQHAESILAAVKTLVAGLSVDDRERVLGELRKTFQPIPQPRVGSGDVLAEIIRLLPEQRSWTVEQIKERVEARGLQAQPKAIYNALTYLKRRNNIVHRGYGQYSVEGHHFVTSDEVDGTPTPHEQHDVET